jgi:predicted transposase YbfD/YdcC
MPDKKPVSIIDHFSVIADPRIERRKEHKLIDILCIAICSTLSGADDFTAMEAFGHAKEEWFRTFLELPNGIPSHDTFGRVFSLIDNQKFCECFTSWVGAVTSELGVKLIAIDGKTSRRSHDKSRDKPAIHMVSAFATELGLTLGQVKTDEKSNEITAILRHIALNILRQEKTSKRGVKTKRLQAGWSNCSDYSNFNVIALRAPLMPLAL